MSPEMAHKESSVSDSIRPCVIKVVKETHTPSTTIDATCLTGTGYICWPDQQQSSAQMQTKKNKVSVRDRSTSGDCVHFTTINSPQT